MSGLSYALANLDYVDTMMVKVTVEVLVNNARPGHTAKTVSVCTPRPALGVTFAAAAYTLTLADGHDLNPDGLRNRIDLQQKNRAAIPVWSLLTFKMLPDGLPFTAADGRGFVVAFRGDGEEISGLGADGTSVNASTFGDPPADRTTFEGSHRWVGSAFRNAQVELVPQVQPVLRSRLGPKRGAFRRS